MLLRTAALLLSAGFAAPALAQVVTIAPLTLPNATAANAYSQTLTASGGAAPYAFAITAGALPAGLSLSPGGMLSGTPTAGGPFNFTATATDANSIAGSRAYALVVNAPTIAIAPTTLPAGTISVAYSQSVTAAGGVAPYSYAVMTGALPTGLSLAPNGTLSGTPATGGTFNFTIWATDSSTGGGPYSGARAYSLTVNAGRPVANPVSATVAYGSTANPITLSLSGGAATSVAVVSAAAHGTATASGTSISYTPAAGYGGPDSFTYTATNANGTSAAATVTVTVGAPTITLAPTILPAPTMGVAYSRTITAANGMAPYSYIVSASSLPTGITLDSGGVLSGTPTTAGSFNFTLRATDSSTGSGPYSGARAYSVTVTLSPPVAGAVSATVAYGSTANPITLNLSGGAATSVAIASAAAHGVATASGTSISYTPTVGYAGSDSFTYTATNASGTSAPATVTLTVGNPTLVLTPAAGTLPLTYAAAYAQTFSGSGGSGPYSYVLSGTLPAGVSFNAATGTLAGTPTQPGSFPVTVTATDSSTGAGAPFSVTQSYTLNISAPTITLTPASLPDTTAGLTYNENITATGGMAQYGFTVTSGALPTGLALSGGGVLSGTTTASGSFNFTVTASDANGQTASRAYTIVVASPTLTLNPGTLPDGIAGTAYSQALTISGGIAPYTAALTGVLPTGLSFNATTQTLSGAPTQSGTFNLGVTATDSTGGMPATVTIAYVLTIASPTLTLTPAAGTLTLAYGAAYSQAFTAGGSPGPYSYVLSGALPTGVTFSGGTLSGTPTAPGSYAITVTATNTTLTGAGAPFSVTQSYTLNVPAPTLVVDPATLPGTTAGLAYSENITATGGVASYSFAVTSGTLPTGVTLSNDGALSGTTTASGTFTFSVTATDTHGQTAVRAYTVVVATPTLTLDPGALPDGIAGTAYSQTVSASGGIAPYRYALTSGALPAGMSFNNGALSGTPTASGSFSFDITATDSTAGTAATVTRTYTLVIAAATLSLNPASLPAGIAGTAYNQALTASGGIAPYTYALTSGALPAGLSLSGTGVLAGTSTVAGSFTFGITASDSTGGTAATVSGNFTLAIAAPVITINPARLPDGVRGSAYSQVLSASGGTAAYAFALSGGALPAGVTLAADGTLAGTPTADGNFSFAVTVTDALGFTATANTTWVVAMDPPAVVDDVVATLGGAVVSIPVTANDTGTISSIAIVAAPAHGTATVNGLEVAYTPEAGFSGADSFRYTATGPGGTSAEATVQVTVNPLPVAVSRRLAANAGVAVEVDLTEGATGGPFTAATLVSLAPASAGTASIAQVGSGDAARYVLTYTPAATFSGLATVRFTLGNAYATSAEATIEFDVTKRPDPSQDPEVRALLTAQAAATRRFATAQINNFQQRLENIHGDGDSRFSNQVSFSADSDSDCENQVGRIPGRRCEHQARNDEVAHATAAPAEAGNAQGAAFGTWSGGVIRSGNHDGRGGNAGIDFESDGLSVGADYRLNRKFAFGGGLGWGRDDSDVGEHGSRSEGKAYTAALYASFHPGDRLFLDGLMGYQSLSYDLRRYVTSNGALVQGARDGSQWFASLSAGADIRHGEHLQLTPYARLDLARATLDAYTEHGDPLYSLHYADMDVDTTTGNLGLRVDYRYKLSRGLFSPQLRLEYQHDFQGNGDATMGYADQLSGPFYRAGVEIFDRNRFVLGLGAQFSTDSGLSTRIEYRGVAGDGEDSDHGLMLNIEKRY